MSIITKNNSHLIKQRYITSFKMTQCMS